MVQQPTFDDEQWQAMAEILAAMNDGTVGRIVAAHVSDERGRCRACTTAGTGTPSAHWPCRTRLLADRAQAIRRRRST